jgi:hypothetical protein
MINKDCISARMIDLIVGGTILAIGVFFVLSAVTVFPIVGFFIAVPLLLLAPFFLFAPADKTCHIT